MSRRRHRTSDAPVGCSGAVMVKSIDGLRCRRGGVGGDGGRLLRGRKRVSFWRRLEREAMIVHVTHSTHTCRGHTRARRRAEGGHLIDVRGHACDARSTRAAIRERSSREARTRLHEERLVIDGSRACQAGWTTVTWRCFGSCRCGCGRLAALLKLAEVEATGRTLSRRSSAAIGPGIDYLMHAREWSLLPW